MQYKNHYQSFLVLILTLASRPLSRGSTVLKALRMSLWLLGINVPLNRTEVFHTIFNIKFGVFVGG